MNTLHQYRLDPREMFFKRDYRHTVDEFIYPFLSENIQDSDERDWPPEFEDVLWGPDSLEENSFSLLKLHKLILLKYLEPKIGVFSEINLWDWHWKKVVLNYPSKVLTKESYRSFEIEETLRYTTDEYLKINDDYLHLLLKALPCHSGSWEDREEVLMRKGRGTILNDEEYSRIMECIEYKRNQRKGWNYIAVRGALKQSTSSGFYYGCWSDFLKHVERECPANVWSNWNYVIENILVSRFALWWGWSDAPFTCMARLIHSHLDTMVREGYLLRELNKGKAVKYQLSEDGCKRLIASKDGMGKNKWLGLLRSEDLASTTKEIILNLITNLF